MELDGGGRGGAQGAEVVEGGIGSDSAPMKKVLLPLSMNGRLKGWCILCTCLK